MSAIWNSHATKLAKYLNCNNELQAHLYLEQLMLFPVNIQDKIIEEISHLTHWLGCNLENTNYTVGQDLVSTIV
jgi:hypothetical protein